MACIGRLELRGATVDSLPADVAVGSGLVFKRADRFFRPTSRRTEAYVGLLDSPQLIELINADIGTLDCRVAHMPTVRGFASSLRPP